MAIAQHGMRLNDFEASVLSECLWSEVEVYGLDQDDLFISYFREHAIPKGNPRIALEHAIADAQSHGQETSR